MRHMSRSSESNAVPIVAILAGAIVGVVSPVAVAAVARRSKRELDASAARQRAALDAERERLQSTLAAEGLRQRRETERRLLDRGTVLIADFRAAVADVKLDPRGRPLVTDRWRAIVHEVAAEEAASLLWECARKREPWAVQALLQRLAPETKQIKLTHGVDDEPTIDYTRFSDEELEHLDRLLERAKIPAAISETGEGQAQLESIHGAGLAGPGTGH